MYKPTDENKMFERRTAYAFFFFISICLFSILRLSVISSGEIYSVMQENQSVHRIFVSKLRGTVYDCSMTPITNNKTQKFVAVPPTESAVMDVPSFLSGEKKQDVLKKLKSGEIALAKPEGKVNSKEIAQTDVYYTESRDYFPTHILGYTDNTGHGVCGIEKAYDEYLYIDGNVEAVYDVDAKGRMLYGNKISFDNDLSSVFGGVALTVDLKIQNIVNEASRKLTKGAAIVCEAKSGKIRAIESIPEYDLNDIQKSLQGENSPMLNRAITAFSVGSVFKPCVAAAGFNIGKNTVYNCVGKAHIIDRDFSCHKHDGHGVLNLLGAISFSCNTYFYNFGIKIGAEKIFNMASTLNFGNRIRLCENFYSDEGHLTTPKEIDNDAKLANFSIGQGNLMLTPVSMLTLYMSIANGGYYILPSVVEGTVSGGEIARFKTSSKTVVFGKDCAEYLRKSLINVVVNGTGSDAKSEKVSIAGKTATAQTGRYLKNGTEITNSWFCGFFPSDNPKYVAVIMSDGQTNTSVGQIFREIAEKISELS